MRTDDGKVLRIGKDSNSIYSLIIKMVYLTLSVGFCVFVLCTVLAHRLTRRLVAPIERWRTILYCWKKMMFMTR